MVENKNIKREKSVRVIKVQIREGRELQDIYPQLVSLRRKGRTYSQIIDELNLKERYNGASDGFIGHCITYALIGHDGSFEVDSFSGMMPKEEHDKLVEVHRYGNSYYIVDKKLGAQTTDKEIRRTNAINGNITRGNNHWDDLTLEILYRLSQDPDYWHTSKKYAGRSDLKKLLQAFKVVSPDHIGTSVDSLKQKLSGYRRLVEKEKIANLEKRLEQAA